MGTSIAVLGAGANGAALGADLTRAGHDVTLLDAWAANVEALRADGAVVVRPSGTTTTPVTALHLGDVAGLRRPFDIVFLGVKAYDTEWASVLARSVLADDGVLVGVQNGMTLATTERVVGEHRALGCVIEVAASMFTPGVVVQQAPLWFAVGSRTEAAQAWSEPVCALLADAGTASATDDIVSAKWMKLVANAAELVTSAVLDLPLAEAVRVPGMLEVMRRAGTEAARVAVAEGSALVPLFAAPSEQGVGGGTPEAYAHRLLDAVLEDYTLPDTLTTVLQDWRKGRRAEIDDLNGHVVERGQERGIRATTNAAVLRLARAIEAGAVAAGPENAQWLIEAGRVADPYRDVEPGTVSPG